MSKVFTALAVSVDGFITGRDPRPGHPLGDGGTLFDWYDDPCNFAYFDAVADRVGAVVTGRTTYDDCEGFDGGSPHRTAPMVVVSHRPQPPEYAGSDQQSFAETIEGALERAGELAGDKDVGIQGGVTLASAIDAGLVDEVILHQVPALLGAGRPFFAPLAGQLRLTLLDTVQGSGVAHLVCPAARGQGRRMFEDKQDLQLAEAAGFENGVVLLRYEIKKKMERPRRQTK